MLHRPGPSSLLPSRMEATTRLSTSPSVLAMAVQARAAWSRVRHTPSTKKSILAMKNDAYSNNLPLQPSPTPSSKPASRTAPTPSRSPGTNPTPPSQSTSLQRTSGYGLVHALYMDIWASKSRSTRRSLKISLSCCIPTCGGASYDFHV